LVDWLRNAVARDKHFGDYGCWLLAFRGRERGVEEAEDGKLHGRHNQNQKRSDFDSQYLLLLVITNGPYKLLPSGRQWAGGYALGLGHHNFFKVRIIKYQPKVHT
jgi:hypothetical protein